MSLWCVDKAMKIKHIKNMHGWLKRIFKNQWWWFVSSRLESSLGGQSIIRVDLPAVKMKGVCSFSLSSIWLQQMQEMKMRWIDTRTLIHNLHLIQHFLGHRAVLHAGGCRMAGLPCKMQTLSSLPPFSLVLSWFNLKPSNKKSSSSCQFHATDVLAKVSVILNIYQGFPVPEAHARFV